MIIVTILKSNFLCAIIVCVTFRAGVHIDTLCKMLSEIFQNNFIEV